MTQPFVFRSSALPDAVKLVGFRGREAISSLYELHVFVHVASDDDFDPDAAVGFKASLSAEVEGGAPYAFHGVISGVDLLIEESGWGLFRFVVTPRFAQLEQSFHSRMFTGKKLPDIIKETLDDAGIDHALELDGELEEQAHVCQYKESDLAFLSRWMEREGIRYFFEQGEGGEKLVITDAAAHKPPLREPVRFHGGGARDVVSRATLWQFTSSHRSLPASVKLRDYDYAKPALDVSGDEKVAANGAGDIVVHGQRFFTPSEGKRLAKIRAEALLADQTVFRGVGGVFHLRPGYLFELSDHPVSSFDAKYVVTALTHAGANGEMTPEMKRLTGIDLDGAIYEVRIEAVAEKVVFRPARKTPWPRISGFESAVIDAAGGDTYADLDADGRYLVKFGFDESDLKDGKASTRVRMMQPHGGNPEGFHFPLRKGTEVMIAFLNGDPDRPLIAGAIPNAVNPSVVTAANHTRNIVHTGSDNHLEIEDQAGKQWIDLRTPPKDTFLHLGEPHDKDSHYVVENTQGDCLFEIGSNQDVHVGGKLTEEVKGAVDETYSTSQTSLIKGPQKTTVTKKVTETYGSTQLTEVTNLVTESVGGGQATTVDKAPRTEEFNDGQITVVFGKVHENYGGGQKKTVTGATGQIYKSSLKTTVTGAVTQTFKSSVKQLFGSTHMTYKSLDWTITGACKLITPSWNVNIPTDWWMFLQCDTKADTKMEGTGLATAIFGMKIDRTTLSVGINGAKVEAFGAGVASTGVDIVVELAKIDDGGLKTFTAGLRCWP
jgi:type VI secretion system secreted protein VgrG